VAIPRPRLAFATCVIQDIGQNLLAGAFDLTLLTALSPLLLALLLLVVLRLSTPLSMAIALAVSAALALWWWQMPLTQLLAAILEGTVIGGAVLWIMAGAMLLLGYQRQTGQLEVIRHGFARLTADPRLQLLWLGWFGVAFLEGIAGFGTPAAIVAPLLVALGFPPAAAVMLTLIADSAPVSFGALGTPLLIGIAQGAQIESATQLMQVAAQLVWLDLWAAPVLPVLMLVLYCRWFHPQLPVLPALPHALVAGFAYSGSSLLWFYWLGPEFPAVLAAISGFALSLMFQRCWPLALHNPAESDPAALPGAASAKQMPEKPILRPFCQAMAPYIVVIILLLISRLPELPLKNWLVSYQWSWPDMLGTGISSQFSPLYSPGTVFVLVVLLFVARSANCRTLLHDSLKDCWPKLRAAALTLLFAVPLVRIFVHSDVNQAGLPAMPEYLSAVAVAALAEHWLWFSSALGALGSFVAGSATFSNLLFAGMQLDVAIQTGMPVELVLALQMLGANAGNMICLLNLVAVASVVGLQGQERSLLKLTIGPMLIYLALATVLAWWLYR
jgi:lactate permease